MDNNLFPNNPIINILNLINSPIIINSNNILQRSFEEQENQKHPTDKNFIKTLEQCVFNEDQEEISCGICLSLFKKGDKAFNLPCAGNKHYFHIGEDEEECGGILPWLEENNTCPICREKFPEEPEQEVPDIEEEEEDDLELEEPNIDSGDIPIPEGNFDDEEIVDDETTIDEEYDVENQDEVNNNISEFLEEINDDEESPSANDLLNQLSNILNARNRIILPSARTTSFLNIIDEIQLEVQQEFDEDYQLQQAIQRSINER